MIRTPEGEEREHPEHSWLAYSRNLLPECVEQSQPSDYSLSLKAFCIHTDLSSETKTLYGVVYLNDLYRFCSPVLWESQ